MVDHTLNEDEDKWRCAIDWCNKLFKTHDFLKKHLKNKHGALAEAEEAKVGNWL